jgi:hypothetical protein
MQLMTGIGGKVPKALLVVEISLGGRGAEQFVPLGLVLTHRGHREIA